MRFSNTVAYCKGFYKWRGDVDVLWKDLAHCIICDGYMCYTKKSVARHCLARIDDFAKEFPNEAWKVSFTTLYTKLQENKNMWENWSHKKPLDEADYLIWTFIDFIRYNTEDSQFTEGTIPNEKVLPLSGAASESLWNHIVEKYDEFQEGVCFETYEEREKNIN